MANLKPMRWSQADREEFKKIRKNFNAKITRLKGTDLEPFLPKPISQKDIYTREDFHRMKKYAAMFTERGSQNKTKFHGQEVPEFFKKQVQYIQKSENARRAHKRKEFTPERGTSTMQKEAEFSPMRLKGSKSIVDLIKAKERLDAKLLDKNRHNMAVGYRDNYIEGLKKQLGPLAGPIIELLEGLTPEQVAAALEKDFIYSIDFQYSYMDALIKAETLFDAWFSYRRELDPENYTEEEQAEAFIAAYEDVEGEGWEDITERSNVVNLGRVHDPKWTDLAPDEIAALFEEKRAKGEQMKAARKRNKKGRRK